MWQAFVDFLTHTLAEVITILVGALLTWVTTKVNKWLSTKRKKDELGIIDSITDNVVEYTEAEFTGVKGRQKRDFAVERAIEILATKGIKVSRAEILAGIENGVNKLNSKKK